MAISAPDDIAIVEMEAPNRRHSVASLSDIDEDVVYKSFTQLRQRRKSLTQSVGKTKKKGKAEKTEDGFDIDDYRNVQNDGDLQLFTTPGMIFQHIQKQKQVIQNVRFQPWPMRVKKNTVKTAQSYVSQYEGQLSKREGYQERGQQYWRKFQRIWNNLVVIFLPWELRIKTIESHFGSSVASYFVFLRWLTAVNLLYALLWLLVILPEIFVGEKPGESARKTVPVGEEGVALDFDTIWDFNGYVKYSVLFYGYYGSNPYLGNGYQLPLAYLLVGLATYAVSFIVILRKMAANSRMSKMSSPNEQFTFCWKVFTGWDFMIGNAETADKTVAANATVLREAIIEMEEKEKENERKPVTVFLRVLANLLVIIVLCGSGYAIYQVVLRSQEFEQVEDKSTLSWWETNEVSIVVTMITLVCPSLFEMIGAMESYHPRVALRWQLARIMVLYMGNLYTLIIALLGRVSDMTKNSRASYEANMGTLAALRGDLWDVQNQTIHDPYNSTDISRNRNGSISELIRNITNVEDQLKMLGPDDCWETVVGQEFFKLVFFDLVAVVLGTLCGDFLRAVSVRYLNYCCCWDLEMKFPEYPEFKIAENVLHLVYNQGMVWMGCFFSPCLAAFNVLKLVITLYIRAWAVVTCNVPHERIFRASRSNNFYLTLLLVMLFLCVLAFGYSVVAIQPSHNCGPFSNYTSMLDVIGQSMESSFPHWLNSVIDYMNTAGVVVPLLLFLCLDL
ncbi:transmembrane channel-like protein 3 [Glandiceps talaboti]